MPGAQRAALLPDVLLAIFSIHPEPTRQAWVIRSNFFHGGRLMGNPVVTGSAEHAEPPKSFVERFIGVFISPGETFADIVRKPDFIAPMIVLIVITVAVTETMR